jgi:hypothetical protein
MQQRTHQHRCGSKSQRLGQSKKLKEHRENDPISTKSPDEQHYIGDCPRTWAQVVSAHSKAGEEHST